MSDMTRRLLEAGGSIEFTDGWANRDDMIRLLRAEAEAFLLPGMTYQLRERKNGLGRRGLAWYWRDAAEFPAPTKNVTVISTHVVPTERRTIRNHLDGVKA